MTQTSRHADHHGAAAVSSLMGSREVRRCRCLSVPVSTLWHPTDRSDYGPDGPWCEWLDQAEHYRTTHSDWHRLQGLSVLVGGGSAGTTETLQSNKPIRKETDTPVRYRVTETEGTEWEETKTIEGGALGRVHRLKEGDSSWRGWSRW